MLVDPGRATSLYSTRQDVLIPSAVLNATVSGLFSGDFYCFYAVAVDAAGNQSQPSGVDTARAR